ncbi:MAG TPA: exopolysaccharide biosynthesis protein [Thermoanaerobaculaceae bacterium]|nr:exopolysaccharide biosynthesis protein [Thermoanaerobaculaceae bacterium]HPS77681.1 exopolysaccharide biosynthesis protein [Thermoanaerobaculaceae bacterium]
MPDDMAAGPGASSGELPPGHCCRLSEELEQVLRLADGQTVTARVLVDHLSTRGHALLAFFLVIPFLQPVPLPGLSTPFGAAVALLGVLMALGRPTWLPKRWLDRELASGLVIRIVRSGQRLLQRTERFIKPRGRWFHRHRWARPIAGMVIAISGAELALPLPIVFTNTLPALVIATTAVGALEEDAILTVVGEVLFLIALIVFGAIALLPFIGLHIVF